MRSPSQYINDICNNCHPQSYDKTLSKFVDQENTVEVIGDPDGSFIEYLYECCQCGEKAWVDDCWVRSNRVPTPKTLKQRSDYIRGKGAQLDQITDANQYTRRLSRVMLYHKLLTDLEVAEIKRILKGW